MQVNLLLGVDVFLHSAVVVQMLLVNVQKHADMRGYVNVFQLVAGQFADQTGVRVDFLQNIKSRNTDISGKNGILTGFLQNMIEKRGGGTLSFGSGDADDPVTVSLEEHFHLGGEPAGILLRVFGQDDAWTLENQVIFIQRVHIMLAA